MWEISTEANKVRALMYNTMGVFSRSRHQFKFISSSVVADETDVATCFLTGDG